jgi:HB1/ASXL restriction endonuclease-like protein with HTH domain
MKPKEYFFLYEKEVAQFKLELIRRLSGGSSAIEETRPKRTSNLSMVDAVLVAAGKPLHVNDIIAAIEKKFGITLDRDSLSSAIIKQVRKEKRFMRVAPNTFGLRQT